MLEKIVETKPLGHNVDLAERAYRIRRKSCKLIHLDTTWTWPNAPTAFAATRC